jgi:hypothetical protein
MDYVWIVIYDGSDHAWATVCPSGVYRFIPIAEREFAKRWKEAK